MGLYVVSHFFFSPILAHKNSLPSGLWAWPDIVKAARLTKKMGPFVVMCGQPGTERPLLTSLVVIKGKQFKNNPRLFNPFTDNIKVNSHKCSERLWGGD